jgi:DNA-binding PadR family transcriptional regulator
MNHHPERIGHRGGPHRHDRSEPGMQGRHNMQGGPMHGRRGRGGRGRVPRGDVRAAVLLLLADEPMHGYQLMQTIADRSGGRWTPSPGAIYPTLSQLEDEGLVVVTHESGRKLATLTESGRKHVEENAQNWPDPFAESAEHPGANLRVLLEELHIAARQVARNGTDAQRASAAEILSGARRSLYLLLADGAGPDTKEGTDA